MRTTGSEQFEGRNAVFLEAVPQKDYLKKDGRKKAMTMTMPKLDRDKLMQDNIHLVKIIAYQVAVKLPPHIDGNASSAPAP